ncbi:MAG: tetratricopeptide repeat protein [bacterium]
MQRLIFHETMRRATPQARAIVGRTEPGLFREGVRALSRLFSGAGRGGARSRGARPRSPAPCLAALSLMDPLSFCQGGAGAVPGAGEEARAARGGPRSPARVRDTWRGRRSSGCGGRRHAAFHRGARRPERPFQQADADGLMTCVRFFRAAVLAGLFLVFVALLLAAAPGQLYSQQVIKGRPNPEQSRIRLAQDYERRGNYVAALQVYRNLYEQVPRNQLYYEGVKRNMIRLKRFDELVEIIQAQIARTNGVRFYADLGNVYYKQGQHERAAGVWQEALTRYADQKPGYSYIANAMIRNRMYDEAIEVYQKGRQHFNQESLFVFELANIYVLRLKYKEATVEYLKHLERNPNQFAYVESRIVKYTKDPENARLVAEILASHLPRHKHKYLVRKLLADLYLRIEAFSRAMEQFKMLESMEPPTVPRKNSSGKELYFFAEKALNANQLQFAEQAFNLILSKYARSPFRVRALYGIAMAKQKQGLSAQALEKLEELVQLDRRSPWAQNAMFQMGEIYFVDLFELDKALEAYHAVIQKYPTGNKARQAYFRIGDCYAAKGTFDLARVWYQRAASLTRAGSPLRDQADYKIAYLYFVMGEYDKALESLNKVTEKLGQPDTEQDFVNDALELIFLIEENRGAAEAALQAYGEAQKLKLQRNYAEAITSLKHVLATYPSAGVVDETLMELAELEHQRENYVAAIDYFALLLQEHSESVYNALAQKRIAEIYEGRLGDLQKAYEAYEKVLIEYPNSLYVEEVRMRLRTLHERRLNN